MVSGRGGDRVFDAAAAVLRSTRHPASARLVAPADSAHQRLQPIPAPRLHLRETMGRRITVFPHLPTLARRSTVDRPRVRHAAQRHARPRGRTTEGAAGDRRAGEAMNERGYAASVVWVPK